LSIFIVLHHGFASSDKEYVESSKFASKDWSLALRRSRSYPSCVTACPRGSRSRVFIVWLVPHGQFVSRASIIPNWRSPLPRTARPSWLENLCGPTR
jgi:hypothetical protein